MSRARIIVGDCREGMATLADASVDAVVCDPPYELGFMGRSWDASGIAYDADVWRQALRVLKPGGHLLAFSGTRTYHRMTVAIEDAGFEIRDCFTWMYGSGFPKSHDVSKAIDKAAGVEFEASPAAGVGFMGPDGPNGYNVTKNHLRRIGEMTDDARRWSGWGTALKPAWEPIVVARKPLDGTVAGNVLKHGTGAINVDGCRVQTRPRTTHAHGNVKYDYADHHVYTGVWRGHTSEGADGRWPANVLLSCPPDCDGDTHAVGCPCKALDGQSGGSSRFFNRLPIEADDLVPFIYTAKADRSDRDEMIGDVPRNMHPTVKPTALMRHLVRLVTPPGGLVLDPFTGSGSTGRAAMLEGMRFIGCEMSPEYAEIARARIRYTLGPLFAHEVT